MSRDPGDRRLKRRRLFIYRPSPESLTPPTVQSERPASQRHTPSRQQAATGQWPPPGCRLWGGGNQEAWPSTPLGGGATAAQEEPQSLRHSDRLPHLLASPLERAANRILSVELRDVTHQVAPCPRPAPDVRPPAGEEGAVGSSPGTERGRIEAPPLSPEASAHLPAAISPPITEGSSSSCPSPEPPPAKVPRWGLFPFLHSVRNKLESFADIFLSPIKSRPDSQHDLHSQPMTEQHHAYPAAEDRPSPGHRTAEDRSSPGHCTAEDRPSPRPRTAEDRPSPGHCTAEDRPSPRPRTAEDRPSPGHCTAEDHPSPGHRTAEDRPSPRPRTAEDRPSPGHCTAEYCPSPGPCTAEDRPSPGPCTAEDHPSPGPCTAEDRPSPGPCTAEDSPAPCSPHQEEAGLSPCSAPSGMNFQLKIAFCSPVPTLCRPPLQRCLSCPLLPRPPRRRSLEADPREAGCSYRKRRHSVGTVEEFRKIPLSPACLRKEKHPSALWAPRSPAGSDPACANSSPPGRYADEDQVTVASTCDAVEESMAHPGCKEMREGRVSTIQIRKRVTRQDGGLTPLGLPKRVRLHKDDFSLEEIYTNKNYHTPTEKRKFETIFEEPIMKGGALVLTGQRPLRRIMVFRDGGAPRRRRKKKGRGGGRSRRGGNSAAAQLNVELLLQHKLDELDEALQHLEEEELHKAVLV